MGWSGTYLASPYAGSGVFAPCCWLLLLCFCRAVDGRPSPASISCAFPVGRFFLTLSVSLAQKNRAWVERYRLICCGDGWQCRLLLVGELDQLDIQAEGLQFADKNVERLGNTGLDGCFTLDDGLVDLGTAEDVVGLGGEELLQDVGGAVCFKGPDLHLTEALSAELRLTAQRLLSDERVRPDRTSVDLVVDEVRQLEHVDVADGGGLLERIADHAIVELRLARAGKTSSLEKRLDLGLACAVEDRGAEPDAALHAGGDAHGLLVVEVKKLAESGGAGEACLEELADLA